MSKMNFKSATVLMMVAVLCFTLFFSVTGITGAFRVNYSDNFTVYVKSVAEFEKAMSDAALRIGEENSAQLLDEPAYTAVIAFPAQLSNSESITDKILSNTDGVVYATCVSVNGKPAAVTQYQNVESEILLTLDQYVWNVGDEVSFVDKVSVTKGYYSKDSLVDHAGLVSILGSLDVKTVTTEVHNEVVAFSTVKKLSSSLASGKTVISQQGKNGVAKVTEQVTYVNGVESGRSEVSAETVTAPVNKVVTVGTKAPKSTEKVSHLGFVWPTVRSSTVITSYWGDGRGHKGMDFAGPKGTVIYASKAGVVSKVTSSASYGKYVVVDHGNGYKTLYAHCSAIDVSVGQKVQTGEAIARIGNTGRSTGNHLHFEIYKNGTRVDAAPYIGAK